MAAYKVRYDLLPEILSGIYRVKYFLELLKLGERGLTHQFKNIVRSVLWSHF